ARTSTARAGRRVQVRGLEPLSWDVERSSAIPGGDVRRASTSGCPEHITIAEARPGAGTEQPSTPSGARYVGYPGVLPCRARVARAPSSASRGRSAPMDLASKLVALSVYFLVMSGIGLSACRKTRGGEDYMLGGRSRRPFVAALSAGAPDMSGWLM